MRTREETKKVKKDTEKLNEDKVSKDKYAKQLSDDDLEQVTGGSALNPREVWVD